jgi:protein-L-isoaspartate(D-aspartate) O-methyltransferase
MEAMNAYRSLSSKQKIRALHQQLVDQMKSGGHLASRSIEAAFRAVPRHLFLPDNPLEEVYRDQAIATKSLQERVVSSSSQPTMMAIMLQQLDLRPGQRVLEIGAGTGYNAALMARIVGKRGRVVTIDIDEDIVESARTHLQAAGFGHVQVHCTDGFAGYADDAPYDRIILTVNAADIAPAWREQLKSDGRLLLPLSLRDAQVSVAFKPIDDHLESVSVSYCRFVTLRGALAEETHAIELQPAPDALTLNTSTAIPVEAATIAKWLTSNSYEELCTSMAITQQDVLQGLGLWLAVHEPNSCLLVAQGTIANPNIMPMLLHSSGQTPMHITIGLVNEQSLCLLLKEDEQSATAEIAAQQQKFSLKIRSFGTDPQHTLAHQLQRQLAAWQEAERPTIARLHIKAYPTPAHYQKAEQEQVVSKQWTQFVINW